VRELERGTLVDGRYRILNRIGSGGMADVYCAEDTQLGRRVALKLLHQRFADDREFVERFRREASSAAGLSHQHVVGVFDRGSWDGTYYIAMEYLEGRSLKQVILEEAPLHPERAIDVAIQILRAARFAHKRGVIHRDLKPHNVILDGEGRAKVTDFGIARAGASDMTETGSIMGTAQYLSPEQAQGHAVSAVSDLYAVGIILYELLTGRVPFDGESAVTVALKQVSESPVPPSAYNPAVSAELEAAVMRALEKDPGARYADADEFIAALERARSGLGAVPAGGDTAELAAAPLPADATRVLTSQYPGPLVDPVEEESRRRPWPWILLALLALAAAGAAAYALTRPEEVRVPDVVGRPYLGARTLLLNQGFDVRRELVPHPTVEKNQVTRQDPQAGERVEKGSTIVLSVSSGPGTEPIPEVEGRPRDVAARILIRAGFRVRVREEASDDVPEDRVIRTSPPVGTPTELRTRVTLVVSSGKEKATVPAVVGETVDEATATLQNRGLRVAIEERTTEREEPGTVLSQDPAAGTEVEKGSTVELVVAKESDRVEVPDVTGLTEADARSALADADLRAAVRYTSVSSEDEDGIVLTQSPSGGRRARKGSRVILTVGRFAAEPPPTETTTTPSP
jgi:beta-lactam-binding protein with PASTA domain/predicted Ser/Thr protein kinase